MSDRYLDDIPPAHEMSDEDREDLKRCIREGKIELGPGVREKMEKLGLTLDQILAMTMRSVGGES